MADCADDSAGWLDDPVAPEVDCGGAKVFDPLDDLCSAVCQDAQDGA